MENKSSNIKERVLQIAESEGIIKEKFFKKIGMTYGNFKGKSKETPLNSNAIADIISNFPNVNLEWLITGNGNIHDEVKSDYILNEATHAYELSKAPEGRFRKRKKEGELINFYEADFAASNDIEFFDDESNIKPAYTMDIPEFAGCVAFRTYSDSMAPLIKGGDILFASKVDEWQEGLEYGQIYGIIRNDRRRHLKYVRKAIDQHKTHFLLKSENCGMYDDFELNKSQIKNMWLIHGWINKRI